MFYALAGAAVCLIITIPTIYGIALFGQKHAENYALSHTADTVADMAFGNLRQSAPLGLGAGLGEIGRAHV